MRITSDYIYGLRCLSAATLQQIKNTVVLDFRYPIEVIDDPEARKLVIGYLSTRITHCLKVIGLSPFSVNCRIEPSNRQRWLVYSAKVEQGIPEIESQFQRWRLKVSGNRKYVWRAIKNPFAIENFVSVNSINRIDNPVGDIELIPVKSNLKEVML